MLVKPLFYEPVKHIYRLATDPEYRAWCLLDAKLGSVERFRERRVRLHDWDIILADSASFLSAYKEIFVNRIYEFKFPTDNPKILDLGANIGLSVLYFKKIFPKSSITAFEADPHIYNFLKKNILNNGYHDVELINKAVWHQRGTLNFHSEGADGGRVTTSSGKDITTVETIDINEFLASNQYDFLKMDIEGAEETVFPACRAHLSKFKYVFVEYHSKVGHEKSLAEILNILADESFRIDVQSIVSTPSPFTKPQVSSGFDFQLNIFAWKLAIH